MELHNSLNLTPVIEPKLSNFHNRPYLVPHAARFCDSLHESIQSSEVRGLPRNIGAVNQFINSTDLLSNSLEAAKFLAIYK
jgi:hypothetical protein